MPAAAPLTLATTGLGISRMRVDDRVEALAQRAADVRAVVRAGVEPGLEVGARAERAPVAGQHDRAHLVVGRGASASAASRSAPELLVDRVHGVRAVEDDRGHAAAALGLDGHAAESSRVSDTRVGAGQDGRKKTSDRPLHRARAGALDGMGSRGVPALARLRRRAADRRRDRDDDPARRVGRGAPRRRARRARRARAGRRRRHRPGLLRRRAPPEDDQHAPRPRPRRDRAGAAGVRARPARARDLPRDAADERRARRDARPAPARRRRPHRPPPRAGLLRQRRPRRAARGRARWPRAPAARSVTRRSPTITRRSTRWARASSPRAGACSTTSSRRSSCPTTAGRWASSGTRRSTPRSRVVRAFAAEAAPRPAP